MDPTIVVSILGGASGIIAAAVAVFKPAGGPDWSGFTEQMRAQMNEQQERIDALSTDLKSLETRLAAEQAYSAALLTYTRRLYTWARDVAPPGRPAPPSPPPNVSDQIRQEL